jgi:hypothetical protein
MAIDVSNLRPTIVPKSDQLNAEELLGAPRSITVTEVRVGPGEEQPVIVKFAGDDGKPYKPCKTMRKVLVFAWGEDGRTWAGRSMTLYNDQAVKFGGVDVGGIRISHLSHIDKEIRVSLNTSRGKKGLYIIQPLAAQFDEPAHAKAIDTAQTIDNLKPVFEAAWLASKADPEARKRLKAKYDARMLALKPENAPNG